MARINSRRSLLGLFHDRKVRGRVLWNSVFDSRFNCYMDRCEFSVSNGTRIPDLPFGVVCEVRNERNSNLAWITLSVHPNVWIEKDPYLKSIEFDSWREYLENPHEYIETAYIEHSIVKLDTDAEDNIADDAINVWESSVVALDDQHAKKETLVVVDGVNQRDDSETWDSTLHLGFYREIELVNVVGDATWNEGYTEYTEYHSVRPGWWLKTKDIYAVNVSEHTWTINEVVDYHLPPVLDEINIRAWELNSGSFRYYPEIMYSKAAYSGPVEASTVYSIGTAAQDNPTVTQLMPDSVHYNCPFFQLNTGPCLHAALFVKCDIGTTDPTWAENVLTQIDYDATSPVDWPTTMIIDADSASYKGLYVNYTTTITTPTVPVV